MFASCSIKADLRLAHTLCRMYPSIIRLFYLCMCTCECICVRACLCMSMCVYLWAYVHVCVHMCDACLCMELHFCVHIKDFPSTSSSVSLLPKSDDNGKKQGKDKNVNANGLTVNNI